MTLSEISKARSDVTESLIKAPPLVKWKQRYAAMTDKQLKEEIKKVINTYPAASRRKRIEFITQCLHS